MLVAEIEVRGDLVVIELAVAVTSSKRVFGADASAFGTFQIIIKAFFIKKVSLF
jgi:hypothetical protein